MYKKGDYILSRRFGIGKILAYCRDDVYEVFFSEDHLKELVLSDNFKDDAFFLLKESHIESLLDFNKFDIHYTINTRSRAEEYASFKHIDFFVLRGDTITTTICGNYSYRTTLNLKRGTGECSCPVSRNCKHSYALGLFLSKQIKNINTLLKSSKNEVIKSSEIEISFFKEFEENYFNFEIVNKAAELIISLKSAEDIIDFYRKALWNFSKPLHVQAIFDLLYILKPINIVTKLTSIFFVDRKQVFSASKELDAIKTFENARWGFSFSNSPYHYMALKSIIENDVSKFLVKLNDNYFSENLFVSTYFRTFIIEAIKNNCSISTKLIYDISEKYFHDEEIVSLMISELQKKEDILDGDRVIPKVLLKALSKEQLISVSKHYLEDTLNLLDPMFPKLTEEDFKKLANNALIQEFDGYLTNNDLKKLKKCLSHFPHHEFLKFLLEYFSRYSSGIDDKETYPEACFKNGSLDFSYFSKEDMEFYSSMHITYSIHDFKGIFYIKWRFGECDLFNVTYELSNGQIIINEIDSNIDLPFDDLISFIFAYCYTYCNLQQIEENSLHEAYELMLQKEDEDIISSFNEAETSFLKKTTTQLSSEMKVSIEYIFDYNAYQDCFYLTIRLSNGKRFYIVQNFRDFLNRIRKKEYHSYGKDLAFVHSIDNFKEEEKEAIKEIVTGGLIDNYGDRRRVILEPLSFWEILKSLKGRVVNFQSYDYVVKLDEVEFKLYLNEKYEIVNKDYNDSKFINTYSGVVVFDKLKRQINVLKDYKEVLPLIKIATKHNGKSIKRIVDQFKEKVYPIYKEHIVVDEPIINEFITSTIGIESYFDMNKSGHITLESRYIKEDKVLEEKDIQTAYDKICLKNYQNLIASIGFKRSLLIDDKQILNFLHMDMIELTKITKVFLSEELKSKTIVRFVPPKIKMTYSDSMLNVFSEDSIYNEEELLLVLSALKKKKKFVQLKGDRIIELTDNEPQEFLEVVEELNLDKKHLFKKVERPVYQSLSIPSSFNYVEYDDFLKNMVRDISTFKDANFKLPKVNATLRSYQIEGYKWLKVLSKYLLGGILADDMGLGKTLQIITLLKSDEEKKPSLIVGPKSLVFNWKSEFLKFAPGIETNLIYGSKEERSSTINKIKNNSNVVYLTSYDSLRQDIKDYEDKEFNYLILDEAQVIKNTAAQKTQSVKKVKATHRFALSGTPIENDIFDLWSLFDFIMPGYLPNMTNFKENANDELYQSKIAKRVAPFILRRTKQDVLKDLPNKYEHIITAEMTPDQRKLYDAHVYDAKKVLESGEKAFDVLYLLTRLRQICVDPRTFAASFKGESGKTLLIQNIINQYIEEGHRILVFSQFVSALDLLKEHLDKIGIKHLMLTGETDGKKRLAYVEEFNNDENIKVFLISLKAGGNGLNLVGADTVIHYDPWWNLAAENQATDRAHRIGQTKNVEVIKLIMENSIEQRVIELQNQKKDLIDRLISDNDSSITKVTLDDLKYILQ